MNHNLAIISILILIDVVFSNSKIRLLRAGCNPPCANGGSCNKKTKGNFQCKCLIGFFGSSCTKVVNFCKTTKDGHTLLKSNPCQGDPFLSSCSPTVGVLPLRRDPVLEVQTTFAGFACLQADLTATCTVEAFDPDSEKKNVFKYTCLAIDNPDYVYSSV